MHDSVQVCVIVLNWNGRTDTLECLRSLHALRYPSTRILLVDNASVDGTADTVEREFPQVAILRNPANLGFAAGNNRGIQDALDHGADAVLLLNNDTIVDPHLVDELVRAAQQDPAAGMLGGKIYYLGDPHRIWSAGGSIHWWSGWVAHRGIRELDHGQYDTPADVDYLSGCCLYVKRSVIERVGVLDETYRMYAEDADWCIRAKRAGYTLRYQPTAKLWHKVSASSGGHWSWFKNWNKLKSNLRLMGRHAQPYHWLTIPFGMPYRIARSVVGLRLTGKASH